jgi:DNA polymerase II large subunit
MKKNSLVSDKEYYDSLQGSLDACFRLAKEAKSKGIDPDKEVESRVVHSQAEAMEYLVGLPGLADRFRQLTVDMPPSEVPFRLAEDIIYGKFGRLEPEKAAITAIRSALAALTPPGTTAAPMEGIVDVKIKRNDDHSPYLAIYFAAPMRSAGGTEQAVAVILADFVRRALKLERYRPSEDEVNRIVEEIRIYERDVGRFQYRVADEQVRYVYKNLPVEVTGTQSDPIEVTLYRDLPRVETNRLRGGALRVVNDGIVGRRNKVLKCVSDIKLSGWNWLESVSASAREERYLGEVLVGRPVLSFPDRFGGFRLRYGRSRNTGLASMGAHPAAMVMTDGFIAVGTQVRLEKPGKSATIVPVDHVEPPVVKLVDGSVVRVETVKEATNLKDSVTSILFLGDLLVSVGEYVENNIPLNESPYVEEWWGEEVRKILQEVGIEGAAAKAGLSAERLQSLVDEPLRYRPSFDEALSISLNLGIPLHPSHLLFWSNISMEEALQLREVLKGARRSEEGLWIELQPEVGSKIKSTLEKLCLPHTIRGSTICIGPEASSALCFTLLSKEPPARLPGSIFQLLSATSGIIIRNKAPTFLGVRMGRPEAANPRYMDPPVHTLFPVGNAGGPSRNIVSASSKNLILVELASRSCPKCHTPSHLSYCSTCGELTVTVMRCPTCSNVVEDERCPTCNRRGVPYSRSTVDVAGLLKESMNALGIQAPPKIVKGVKSLVNPGRMPEGLMKGILRAQIGLSIFRDGTVRFDASNGVLTEFTPKEVGVPVDRLRQLGYLQDVNGKELDSEDQIVALKPQDVVLPMKCVRHLVKVASFVDELLTKVYGREPFYNVKQSSELIGHHLVGLSPHTYGAILGRIMGFTESEVLFAHPYWHQAKRRDCDGDADSVALVMDVLLNFSRSYLQDQPGGLMDSPLVIFPIVNPAEVDDQVYNLESCKRYPLELYALSCKHAHPGEVRHIMRFVGDNVKDGLTPQLIASNVPTSQMDEGPVESTYRRLGSMTERLRRQMALTDKLVGVVPAKVAERILDSHLLRDLAGNLRAFYIQGARCKRCGAKYRRVPLSGRCMFCRGELIMLVHNKSVGKYLDLVTWLLAKFEYDDYFRQYVNLLKLEIDALGEPRGKKISDYLLADP